MRLSNSNERITKRAGGYSAWGLISTPRCRVNLWPMTGSGHEGLSEYACYGNFLGINIFHFSSVVSNALVMGEKEQTSKVPFNFTILSKFL